jgi:hypothetical protein
MCEPSECGLGLSHFFPSASEHSMRQANSPAYHCGAQSEPFAFPSSITLCFLNQGDVKLIRIAGISEPSASAPHYVRQISPERGN